MLTNQNYMTVNELMERWRCSRPTVWKYLRKYSVRVIELGKKPLVPEEEVIRIEHLRTRGAHV